jgi:Fe-S-cluster-containing hydrogenase component 2
MGLNVLKRLIVSAEKCAGCRHCELVCSFEHEGVFNPELSRIRVIKDDTNGLDYPLTCRNCNYCPPAQNCPTNSITKVEDGIKVQWQDCIECGSCVKSCTYNAIKLNIECKPLICDTCNKDPECAKRCPTQAISYIESEIFTETPNDAFVRMKEKWGIE